MTFEIQLSPHAVRSLKKLDSETKEKIRRAIDTLRQNPSSGPAIKRLKGLLREYYRYRAGDYRIIYEIRDTEKIISIFAVGHRKDIYQKIDQ